MKSEKPIVFLDLETTGVDVNKDRIVEFSLYKYMRLDQSEPPHIITKRVNPTIPIPKDASDVHGITDDMVKDEPQFKQFAKATLEFLENCDVAGFNILGFDAPLLNNEILRAGMIWNYSNSNFIDVFNIFRINETRDLKAAVKFYLQKEHEGAHGASADVAATVEVFREQIKRYNYGEHTPQQLSFLSNYDKPIVDIAGKFTADEEGKLVFNFGKHKGEKASQRSHQTYLEWMLKSPDFSEDTKAIIRDRLLKFHNR